MAHIMGDDKKERTFRTAQGIHAADGLFPCVHCRELLYHVRAMSQPNVWIIDHRDSFTWNLAELVRMTGMAVPRVVSNESPELEQAVQAGEKIILSPGPGTVEDACHRATFRLLDRLPRFTPVLGLWGLFFNAVPCLLSAGSAGALAILCPQTPPVRRHSEHPSAHE